MEVVVLTSIGNSIITQQKRKKLLERYLPPIPGEYAINWIRSQSLKGVIILDPFGASPNLTANIAQNGNRVLVAVNNPILRLLIELTANPPSKGQARTVLSMLSALRVRDERLELHLQDLYRTSCPTCGRMIYAEAFLWKQDAAGPYARIISCEDCEIAGEFPLTAADLQITARFRARGLHHARALGRIAPPKDPDRIHVEEALSVYPPRAVYALLTLVNKLDQLDISQQQSRILMAMLLNAFDQANTLWPHPVVRERPRQLTIPPTYRENNIWLALETALEFWDSDHAAVPITYWPNLPPESGGICLFKGRMKELAEQSSEFAFSEILTSFPRPNQAFWSLSALWAGWLWGPEAVEHFKPVLRRRRYDWAWHSMATRAALNSLTPVIAKETVIQGVIGEAEPGFISSIIIAGDQAGFLLEDIILHPEKKLAHIKWQNKKTHGNPSPSKYSRSESIKIAGRDYLLNRGEPSHYLDLHCAIMSELGKQSILNLEETPAETYFQLHQEIQEALNFQNGFLRFKGSEKSLNVGRWWLRDESNSNTPLSDRIEKDVVRYLEQHPNCSYSEIEAALIRKDANRKFAGQLIPDPKLMGECLESYGEKSESGWKLKDQDMPSRRREEMTSMVISMSELGIDLGFQVQSQDGEMPRCLWLNQNSAPLFAFYISVSALLGKFLLEVKKTATHHVIVLPGGRANLVMFKLSRDPRLQSIMDKGWSFLKFRHARQLINSSSLSVDNFEDQLLLDPLTYSQTQLRMF
jgi:hypothetical protein